MSEQDPSAEQGRIDERRSELHSRCWDELSEAEQDEYARLTLAQFDAPPDPDAQARLHRAFADARARQHPGTRWTIVRPTIESIKAKMARENERQLAEARAAVGALEVKARSRKIARLSFWEVQADTPQRQRALREAGAVYTHVKGREHPFWVWPEATR